jgi:hypothetical protein
LLHGPNGAKEVLISTNNDGSQAKSSAIEIDAPQRLERLLKRAIALAQTCVEFGSCLQGKNWEPFVDISSKCANNPKYYLFDSALMIEVITRAAPTNASLLDLAFGEMLVCGEDPPLFTISNNYSRDDRVLRDSVPFDSLRLSISGVGNN